MFWHFAESGKSNMGAVRVVEVGYGQEQIGEDKIEDLIYSLYFSMK